MPKKTSLSQLWSTLPNQIFISYAYDDGANKNKLLQNLQERAKHVHPGRLPASRP
jgi:hypothetical protein